jgi:hypothetical protein
MNTKSENDENGKQERGVYPYLPLSSALRVSDAVKELGGARSAVPKSALAKHLGESEKSPTFSQRISSAKVFGLVEGRGEYELSELAKRFYFPTSDSGKSSALLEIFATPPSFKEILRRFDGDKLPSREILGNILHREAGIPESWKDRVAAFFNSSAQFVGAISNDGFIRHKAAFHNAPKNEPVKEDVQRSPKVEARPTVLIGEGSDNNIWNFSHGGKTVRLETPIGLDKDLWEKLNQYVQLLKPMGIDMGFL